MKTLLAYFGLDADGTRVSPTASIAISLLLSIVVSVALRFVFPSATYVVRLALWFIVMLVIFRWAAANAAKQRDRTRRRDGR